ncbi:Outer arm dynein light chain 1 protein [Euphorbia peplus]|nr:Outer arm dynein light chain 1 protein [Euphorbia peplus]
MVRFSCFNAHIPSHRSKKIGVPSVEAMHKSLQDSSTTEAPVASLSSLYLNARVDDESSAISKDAFFAQRAWKSDEINGKFDVEDHRPHHERGRFKKSQSLGSRLCHEGTFPSKSEMEEEMDPGFSSDSLDGTKDPEVTPNNQQDSFPRSESAQVDSDFVNDKSIFSIGDPLPSEKESFERYENLLCGENAIVSCNQTPSSPRMVVKSCSLPNVGHFSAERSHKHIAPRSRSCEDLHTVHMKWRELSFHETEMQQTQEQDRKDDGSKTGKNNCEPSVDDGYDSCNYSASAKDWIIPVPDEVSEAKQFQGESSVNQGNEFSGKDFRIKRIEDWVSDLQYCNPLEETNEPSFTNLSMDGASTIVNSLSTTKTDNKVTPGMEAAKSYITSLGASATTAQLSNHGLAVIPFLSAFVSLRVLNLSGNSIVRITSGSLPRGLHMLNLSKNNISTIEGLRELSRLRVLDLSYNRIFRMGHGLASCSSLKELYLAGNKISEVEGLHRLLKLTVLDLRFNKISTAKCLGQLAANYNSLQAISLEGNPAQKNVGDDQLKKYLQTLLPHLVYYNRQAIKLSTLKDAADRSLRLGINAHQSERGLRSDSKAGRKGSHGSRPTSSSSHIRKSQGLVSPKQSRGRHVRLPPAGTKATSNHRHQYFEFSSKILSLKSESMRRSQSEGTLGAL